MPIDPDTLPSDFYYTDAIFDRAVEYLHQHPAEAPFFIYLAYTAPRWPLHAPEELVQSYAGVFDDGWTRCGHTVWSG